MRFGAVCQCSLTSQPVSAAQSCLSTCSFSSSGADTRPISALNGPAIMGGSQSSIELGHFNTMLFKFTQPTSGVARLRMCARACGMGALNKHPAVQSITKRTLTRAHVVVAHSPWSLPTLLTYASRADAEVEGKKALCIRLYCTIYAEWQTKCTMR